MDPELKERITDVMGTMGRVLSMIIIRKEKNSCMIFNYFKKIPCVKQLIHLYKDFCLYFTSQPPHSRIRIHNFPQKPAPQDFWLRDFIESRNLINDKINVAVFSVFGLRVMMRLNSSKIKIFVARENIHREMFKKYNNHCFDISCVDLRLGFDYLETSGYIRFPLWIMWLFPANADFEYIKAWCEKANHPNNVSFSDREFCSLISSHNDDGRQEIFNQISTIGKIHSAGKLFHNNDDLKNKYNDDKLSYLRHYRFNLTPENSNYPGYVTEKLFEAIYCGCIPIYSGSNNDPEPEILNHDAICFINMYKNMPPSANAEVIEKIKLLNNSEEQYLSFARQPRLKPEAAEIIWGYFVKLEDELRKIIENKLN